jgi:ferredoxin-NADP reductase
MDTLITPLLNRYSMYKVISGALTILFVISLLLSLTGTLIYSPLAMLASLTALGVSVLLTGLLFGLIFGVRVHTESSFITAVILFFIFTPTLQISGLLTLALVGMIAGASKFILVYNGRHMFNAVAASAFIISLTGLAHASWWVGSPVLIIPTLLLGYVILLKTRRVFMSGIFAAIATTLVILTLLFGGETLGNSVVLWLSYPIVFFACFMLTEPLTLPRKEWHRTIEVVIVAILFVVPISIGIVTTSPELALLVGNVVAFGFTRQQKISLRFMERKQLTPTSYEYVFTPQKPQQFEAGQYIGISLPHKNDDFRGSRRSFSITSAPGEKTVRLGIKFYEPSSSFKKALRELKKNAFVQATGISGDFTLPKNTQTPLLFVAGGIGITPFISYLQMMKQRGETRDIVLLYAISTIDELAYKDILEASGVKVYVVISSKIRLVLPKGWIHINEAFMTKEAIGAHVTDIVKRTAYISGPPALVDGVKKHLKQLSVKHIRTDYFIGY